MTYVAGMSGCRIGPEMPRLILRLRRIMAEEGPEVVVSFMWEANILNVLSNLLSHRRKIILSERVAIFENIGALFGAGVKMNVAKTMIKVFYRFAAHIIAVSEGLKTELTMLGLPENKIDVIYNPLDSSVIQSLAAEAIESSSPYIVFVGRLTKQKNIPLLIHAFSIIKNEFDIDLMILGKGEEEKGLRDLAGSLNIGDRVIFKGFEINPYKYMRNAEVLVLPSDFEGFPNVLLEAMACGVSIVSTNCPYGPSEIITDGDNGLIVPVGDVHGMAVAIGRLLRDKCLRESFVSRGYEISRKYEVGEIVKRYEELIYNASWKEVSQYKKA
ncbi:MAG: glycosyltransferase [Nitrospirae bacterium]|nr:glycosyltransferase [Nitrospirota bacterium]